MLNGGVCHVGSIEAAAILFFGLAADKDAGEEARVDFFGVFRCKALVFVLQRLKSRNDSVDSTWT